MELASRKWMGGLFLLACAAFSLPGYELETFLRENLARLWTQSEAGARAALPAMREDGKKGASVLRLTSDKGGGEKVTFCGRAVSKIGFEQKNGRVCRLFFQVPFSEKELADDRDEKRERERFYTVCALLDTPKDAEKDGVWQCLRLDGAVLNTVCARGGVSDWQIGSRARHAELGSLVMVSFAAPGFFERAGDGGGTRDFEVFLSRHGGELFQCTVADVQRFFSFSRLSWSGNDRTQLRYGVDRGGRGLRFCGIDVQEALFSFRDGKFDSAEFSLFNQGDSGKLDRKQFAKLRDTAALHCKDLACGAAPKNRNLKMDGDTKLVAQVWSTPEADYMLKWDETKRDSSYLGLVIDRPGDLKDLRCAAASKVHGVKDLKECVVKTESGDFLLDVPMVDQGGKGYCTAAGISRVLKYYGVEADQYLLAKLANVDAREGASVTDVFEMLNNIRSKTKIQLQKINQVACFRDTKAFERFIGECGKLQKKMHRDVRSAKITMVNTKRNGHNGYDLYAIIGGLYYDTFVRQRCRDTGGMKGFEKQVVTYIGKGVPLCWGMMILGDGKTPPVGKIGVVNGHLRLIVGVNPSTHEILYSDSWGREDAPKRMKLEDAWAATMVLFAILPR